MKKIGILSSLILGIIFSSHGQTNRIENTGNVGIGTTTPSSMLHLKDPAGGAALKIERGNKSWNFSIQNTGDNLYLNNSDNSSTFFTFRKDGKFGIGTTNPQERFQIGNTYTFHDGGHKVIGFLYKPSGGVDLDPLQYSSEIRFDPVNGDFRFGTSASIIENPVTRLSINKTGNVGIGITDTKGFKLGVKGKIAAEEIKVALYNAWPDYVFENDYNLPTLQEVENHITKKGHLENIPSAVEVSENGILLGEMNAKLLQKIEELTLYMIDQNKKTEKLIKEVEILKQKNEALEKKIK